MKILIFIESNTTGTGKIFLERAAQSGLTTVIIYKDASRYNFLDQTGFIKIHADTSDIDCLEQTIRQQFNPQEIAGIWSTSEFYIPVAAALASLFGLPALDAGCIARVRNKNFQREMLNQHTLSKVPFTEIKDKADIDAFISKHGYPVIIKPTDGSGSVGVIAVTDDAALESALSITVNHPSLACQWMVERYYPGEQYSAEVFNGKLIGITHQHYDFFPRMIAVGHDFPANISHQQYQIITDLVLQAVELFGLTAGPVHVELRLTSQGEVKIIEINPRLAGGYIPEIIRLATGRDLITDCIRFSTNQAPALINEASKISSIRFIVKGQNIDPDKIQSIQAKYDGITCFLDKKKSRSEPVFGDFRDRCGHIILTSSTTEMHHEKLTLIEAILSGQETKHARFN
ncbi:ATP-grasp domain-containing protein [Enterobacter asburiae]|jgi:argininosuccinate lyase|uniref:ATP-grasp domain-containing protein n=1 Tax=Enterobacter asburiae TaxID=61645 RepID=UPI0007E5149D|nr:ATP-grasp domain-containing protein [Enterobacter asburiae]OAY20229.1 hypothetical protein AXY04_04680 [Enterobacter asburiae]